MNTTLKEVSEARDEMHKEIGDALTKFTTRTGITIQDTRWEYSVATSIKGGTIAFKYWNLKSVIVLGE
jgi:hypothetical protein